MKVRASICSLFFASHGVLRIGDGIRRVKGRPPGVCGSMKVLAGARRLAALFAISTTLFLVPLTPPPAYAEESRPGGKWVFTIAPYVFFTGFDGDVTVRGIESDVDASFSDIFDALDFAGLIYLEAARDRFGLFADLTYLKMSVEEEITVPVAVLSPELDSEAWIVELGGFFRLGESPVSANGERKLSIDVLAGGRYWSLDNELDLRVSTPQGSMKISVEETKDWIDPFFGARFQVDLPRRFVINARGDIGGFSIGDSSDVSWHILALLGYRLSGSTILWAGYRNLHVDYDEGSGTDRFEFDVTMSGPIAGVSYSF